MIQPYTILDVRSHTLYEPYHYDTQGEAMTAFEQMAIHAIKGEQTRQLHLYQDAILIKTFSLNSF
jgi:hypothetical protein